MTEATDTGKWNGIALECFRQEELVDYPVIRTNRPMEYPSKSSGLGLTIEAEGPREEVTQKDQLEVVLEQGFVPGSNRELSIAFSILKLEMGDNGPAKFLNNVLIHQQNSKAEVPSRALYEIINDVVGYIRGSRASLETLADIQDRIVRQAEKDKKEQLVSQLVDELSDESVTLVGLKAVIRKQQVIDAIDENAKSRMDLEDIDKTEVQQDLSEKGYSELLHRAVNEGVSAKERLDFWISALKGFEKHGAVSATVRDLLGQLNIKKQNTP